MAVRKASGGGKGSARAVAEFSSKATVKRSNTVLYTYLERTLKSDRMRRKLHEGAVEYETGGHLETETVGGRRA